MEGGGVEGGEEGTGVQGVEVVTRLNRKLDKSNTNSKLQDSSTGALPALRTLLLSTDICAITEKRLSILEIELGAFGFVRQHNLLPSTIPGEDRQKVE